MNVSDALYNRALNLARQYSDAFVKGSFTINYGVNASLEDLRSAIKFLSSLKRASNNRK